MIAYHRVAVCIVCPLPPVVLKHHSDRRRESHVYYIYVKGMQFYWATVGKMPQASKAG